MILEYILLGKGPFTGPWGKARQIPALLEDYHLLHENEWNALIYIKKVT